MSGFVLPADGWFELIRKGEFPHFSGAIQVVDDESLDAQLADFKVRQQEPGFAGILIDFDHFSTMRDKSSEAGGWIMDMIRRENSLMVKPRFSDIGEVAVKGGRFRFLSPVWKPSDCIDLGGGRLRPTKLINVALTNEPNIRGLQPLTNRYEEPAGPLSSAQPEPVPAAVIPSASVQPTTILVNRATLQWAFGLLFNRAESGGLLLNGFKSEAQKRWFFAQQGGGGDGGSSSGGGGSGDGSSSGGNGNKAGGSASGGGSGFGPGGSDTGSEKKVQTSFKQIQLDASRKAMIAERDRVVADLQNMGKPEPKSFKQTDIRELQRKMMADGESMNKIIPALKQAEAENQQKRKDYADLKRSVNEEFKDPAARKRALEKELKKLDKAYEKDSAAFDKAQNKLTDRLMALDNKIEQADIMIEADRSKQDLKATSREDAAAKTDDLAARKAELAASKETAKAAKAEAKATMKAAKEKAYTERYQYWDAAVKGDTAAMQKAAGEGDYNARRALDSIEALGPKPKGLSEASVAWNKKFAKLAAQPIPRVSK